MQMRTCRWITIVLLGISSVSSFAQTTLPRLIVRGDDMGYAHSGNEALVKSHQEGIETAIEVLVPSPWFPEAVELLKQLPNVDVGIHLALTSEWDNVKWRPLSECPSLRDADGYFYPMIYPNKNYPKRSVVENNWQLADIEKELRAQIELGLKKIPRVSHLSGHMGCLSMTDDVKALASKLAGEYHLLYVDGDMQAAGLERASYIGAHTTSAEKQQSFLKMLDKLEPGKTYLFVDHPGLDTAETQAIHHIGYEDVATDRQGVTDTWTAPTVKAFIKTKGIQLIGYNTLAKP